VTSFADKELLNSKSQIANSNNLNFIKDLSALLNNNHYLVDNKYNTLSSGINVGRHFSQLNSLGFYNYDVLSDSSFLKNVKSIYYNFYVFNSQKSSKSRFDYKEINTNISSIKRLRVSKGICLPSDFSIHIICASKDVIHS
jgi:hypothetical protein